MLKANHTFKSSQRFFKLPPQKQTIPGKPYIHTMPDRKTNLFKDLFSLPSHRKQSTFPERKTNLFKDLFSLPSHRKQSTFPERKTNLFKDLFSLPSQRKAVREECLFFFAFHKEKQSAKSVYFFNFVQWQIYL